MEVSFSVDCVLCLNERSCIVYHPCKHYCVCDPCDKMIEQALLSCPLCSMPIMSRVRNDKVDIASQEISEPTMDAWLERRRDYLRKTRVKKLFKRPPPSGRLTARRVTFSVQKKNQLIVDYVDSRRNEPIREIYPYVTAEHLGQIAYGGKKFTLSELAEQHPQLYFLYRYHHGPQAEAAMQRAGLL